MVGRLPCILSLSLVLTVGCGKKNTEPTSNPDSTAPSSDEATGEADDATQSDDSDADVDATASVEDAAESRRALLKLKLVRGGKTIEHPGYMVTRGEEVIVVMTQGKRTHEVDFLFEAAEDGYAVQVTYRDNGREVLRKSTTANKQQWVELKSGDGKTALSVFIDPDAGRLDEVEMTNDDDPLGGC